MNRESQGKGHGNDTGRQMLDKAIAIDDPTPQNPWVNWTKIIGLLCFTFGLIALIWEISYAIEHMKGDGSLNASFVDGGGLILGLFLVYIVIFGVAWYCGYQKRDQIRRDAVETQIARERALQELNNIQ